MTQGYIQKHFSGIKNYANVIEKRLDDNCFTKEMALEENLKNLELCKKNNCPYILIDENYQIDIEKTTLNISSWGINSPETSEFDKISKT